MNEKKSAAYRELVKKMADGFYPKYGVEPPKSDKAILWAPYINGENICKEINLYTYWQGLGYAENTPKIKYLLVAQDFGNIFGCDNSRIERINAGEKNLPYFETTNSFTDNNLIKLFKILGYDILNNRYSDLFFTNFCLGYITDGKISYDYYWLKNDSSIFRELCEILEPENILCLGQLTSECAYKALNGAGSWKKIYGGFRDYNDFIENHDALIVKCGDTTARFYPLAHCSGMGTANRNRNLPKKMIHFIIKNRIGKKFYEVNK